MKIKTGGGGVDENGVAYKLPEEEIEVPDGFFKNAMSLMKGWKSPEVIVVSPQIFEHLKEIYPPKID